MIYTVSPSAIVIFVIFVLSVLGLSFYFARKSSSAAGYYAAGGNIHWFVNGIAFAGDYLSAASFLGICGMIAFFGYDGFLYSIGFLAGWVVALFIVAEPLKRMGKYTFADALDAKFNSRGIKLTAAISTLVVSIFYLIPQMVGAGALVTPLLGFPHWVGVVLVGSIVIFIVATAGMTSTTYVQFIKGGLLIVFSTILTIYVLNNGIKLTPNEDYHQFITIPAVVENGQIAQIESETYQMLAQYNEGGITFAKLSENGIETWWSLKQSGETTFLEEALSIVITAEGEKLYNGAPKQEGRFYQVGHASKIIYKGEEVSETGPLGPFEYIQAIENTEVTRFLKKVFDDGSDKVKIGRASCRERV